jgi:glycosyltransferase involved in cell wall biosynthesis
MGPGSKLRVLFDAYWWLDGPPSGKNVVRGMVSAWSIEFPEDEIELRVAPGAENKVKASLTELTIPAVVIASGRWQRLHAIAVTLMRRARPSADLCISQNFTPIARTAAVKAVFVHDVIYVRSPEWFSVLERAYLGAIRPLLKFADLVLTSSMSEQHEIERVWPETIGRTNSVGLGVPTDLFASHSTRPKLNSVEERPYFLTVGRLNIRKNLANLIAGFDASGLASRYDLLIVGSRDGREEAYANASGVQWTGHVTNSDLRWLYENSVALVFPSLDEGFGLPIVEAAAFGASSIVSDIPAFRELDLAADYFNPRDPDEIANAMIRFVQSSSQISIEQIPVVLDEIPNWSATVSAIRKSALKRTLQ